jgi:superfamily II DNA or RNA helicase
MDITDITDITDFLPKYPNILTPINQLLNPYDNDDFYKNIYNKKEFYDERLEPTENISSVAGNLLKHQKIISRFFSSYTPYNELLLFHAMGTGKSCSAIGAIENIKNAGGFRGVLYIAKGAALINNFRQELIFKCTAGQYIPEDYENLTELEKVHRTKKTTNVFYNFNTFETFAKKIKETNDNILQEKYNNFIIVIDEIHHLRIQNNPKGLNIYKQFNHFLHTVQNCKTLLLSGTPMKDNVDEIASVMNLILPTDKSLPTGEQFINDFFTSSSSPESSSPESSSPESESSSPELYPLYHLTIKPEKKDDLKNIFKGRVSYLRAMESSVEKIFNGRTMGTLKYFNVVPDIMSPFQTKVYNEAFKLDTTGRQGVYSNSRQASLFVFPDGLYGKEGFNKYIKKTNTGKLVKKQKLQSFSLTPLLLEEIRDSDETKMLEKIQKYSTIYAETIKNILEARKEGKCVFVYNEFIEGSGLLVFGLILELFGFSKASGSESLNNYASRYASLTSLTSTTSQIQNLVSRFNKPDNMNGKVINVIVGSRIASEGFSFQNIQVEEIQTPWYNYAEIAQAIARGDRLGSHKMLIEAGQHPKLDIYQRVSIPDSNESGSIDLKMYELSEIKDVNIKGVERLIKEASFDCSLNYKRNKSDKHDTRDCEYINCEYKCDGVINLEDTPTNLDYSTYQLYYNKESIDKIIDVLKIIFRDVFTLNIQTIYDKLSEISTENYTQFDLITSLRKMTNENIIIINKYGFPSYLKEEYNIYFLIDNLSVSGTIFSDYYTQYPHIKCIKTFSEIFYPIYMKQVPQIIDFISKSTNIDDIQFYISKLSLSIKEQLLESSLLAEKLDKNKNIIMRELILKYFDKVYAKIDNVTVSYMLKDKQDIWRCLVDETWENCSPEDNKKIEKHRKDIKTKLIQNPYGYFGQRTSLEPYNFCIRKVQYPKPKQGHKIYSGQLCNTWNRKDLYDLAINKLKIPLPSADIVNKSISELMKKNKILKRDLSPTNRINTDRLRDAISKIDNRYSMLFEDTKTVDGLLRIIYYGTMQKKEICNHIQDFFDSKGLLDIDDGCGKKGTKKPEI